MSEPTEATGPVKIAKPTKSAKGERVRAAQESGEASEFGGMSVPGVDYGALDSFDVELGYGPGKRFVVTHRGRTFTLRPFALSDWAEVCDVLEAVPDCLFAAALDVPSAPGESVKTAPKTALFLLANHFQRQAMERFVFLAFAREEREAGRAFTQSDLDGLVDFANFGLFLRAILAKNLMLRARLAKIFGAAGAVSPASVRKAAGGSGYNLMRAKLSRYFGVSDAAFAKMDELQIHVRLRQLSGLLESEAAYMSLAMWGKGKKK